MMTPRVREKIHRWAKRAGLAVVGGTLLVSATLAACWWAFPFPVQQLTQAPESVTLTDARGGVLLRTVGRDQQWREVVELARVGPWMIAATVAAEDQRFWSHRGIDQAAVARAIWQNVTAARVVSGASTISMQVARMCEPRERTIGAKLVQAFRAVQLEQCFDKRAILESYLNMAPYGGNYRGVEVASRRWFGKSASDLTLAEAALLAGLPKSPESLRPDRHGERALARRNWVLARMVQCGSITQAQCDLAQSEPLRLAPQPRVREVPHAAWLALCERPRGGATTIDPMIQQRLERTISQYASAMAPGTQVSGVVIDIEHASVVAMVGASDASDVAQGCVNGAVARRSPGSALKPFIYAAAFEGGRLSPDSIVQDVPINRAGWTPENFSHGYAGEVTVAEALRKSLNVPAILVSEGVGVARIAELLRRSGVDLSDSSLRRAGLGLAVGTVEVTLLELTNAYATLGRGGLHAQASFFARDVVACDRAMSQVAAASVSDILSCRHREPSSGATGRERPWFCWKTGTSSGRRDAWALGHNGRYAAGIWVGAFSGKGSVTYVGAQAAEPVLAELFASSECANTSEPPPPPPILVTNPLPAPKERAMAMRIVSPAAGAVFVATTPPGDAAESVRAVIAARSSRAGVWFLNGRMVSAADRLCCEPGAYELRCVSDDGSADAIRFTVAIAPRANGR